MIVFKPPPPRGGGIRCVHKFTEKGLFFKAGHVTYVT